LSVQSKIDTESKFKKIQSNLAQDKSVFDMISRSKKGKIVSADEMESALKDYNKFYVELQTSFGGSRPVVKSSKGKRVFDHLHPKPDEPTMDDYGVVDYDTVKGTRKISFDDLVEDADLSPLEAYTKSNDNIINIKNTEFPPKVTVKELQEDITTKTPFKKTTINETPNELDNTFNVNIKSASDVKHQVTRQREYDELYKKFKVPQKWLNENLVGFSGKNIFEKTKSVSNEYSESVSPFTSKLVTNKINRQEDIINNLISKDKEFSKEPSRQEQLYFGLLRKRSAKELEQSIVSDELFGLESRVKTIEYESDIVKKKILQDTVKDETSELVSDIIFNVNNESFFKGTPIRMTEDMSHQVSKLDIDRNYKLKQAISKSANNKELYDKLKEIEVVYKKMKKSKEKDIVKNDRVRFSVRVKGDDEVVARYTNIIKKYEVERTNLSSEIDMLDTAIDKFPAKIKGKIQLKEKSITNVKLEASKDRMAQLKFQQRTLKYKQKTYEKDITQLNLDKTILDRESNVPWEQTLNPLARGYSVNISDVKNPQNLLDELPTLGTNQQRNVKDLGLNVYFTKYAGDINFSDKRSIPIHESSVIAEEARTGVKSDVLTYNKSLDTRFEILEGTNLTKKKIDDVLEGIDQKIKLNKNIKSGTEISSIKKEISDIKLTGDGVKIKEKRIGSLMKISENKQLVAKKEISYLKEIKKGYEKQRDIILKAQKLKKQKKEIVHKISNIKPKINDKVVYDEFGKATPIKEQYSTTGVTSEGLGKNIQSPLSSKISKDYHVGQFLRNQEELKMLRVIPQHKSNIRMEWKVRSSIKKYNRLKSKSEAIDVKLTDLSGDIENTRVPRFDREFNVKPRFAGTKPIKPFNDDVPQIKSSSKDVTPKAVLAVQKTKTKQEKDSLLGYITKLQNTNAVQTAYGQRPIYIPPTVIRYPPNTSEEIKSRKQSSEGETLFTQQPIAIHSLQPEFKGGDFGKEMAKVSPVISMSRVNRLGVNIGAITTPKTGFESMPVFGQTPDMGQIATPDVGQIVTPDVSQIVTPRLGIPHTPITTGVLTTMTDITSPSYPPIPPPQFYHQEPRITRKKPLKKTSKKIKKRKIYWDVPDSPFKSFNPKEYWAFKSEPRSVKRKERRKGLD